MILPISQAESKSMAAPVLTEPMITSTFAGSASGSSKISSLGQLRSMNEELYNKILGGLAYKICHEQERANARLKKFQKENQANQH